MTGFLEQVVLRGAGLPAPAGEPRAVPEVPAPFEPDTEEEGEGEVVPPFAEAEALEPAASDAERAVEPSAPSKGEPLVAEVADVSPPLERPTVAELAPRIAAPVPEQPAALEPTGRAEHDSPRGTSAVEAVDPEPSTPPLEAQLEEAPRRPALSGRVEHDSPRGTSAVEAVDPEPSGPPLEVELEAPRRPAQSNPQPAETPLPLERPRRRAEPPSGPVPTVAAEAARPLLMEQGAMPSARLLSADPPSVREERVSSALPAARAEPAAKASVPPPGSSPLPGAGREPGDPSTERTPVVPIPGPQIARVLPELATPRRRSDPAQPNAELSSHVVRPAPVPARGHLSQGEGVERADPVEVRIGRVEVRVRTPEPTTPPAPPPRAPREGTTFEPYTLARRHLDRTVRW